MVKNDAGGNKGKGLARKHVNAAKCGSSKQLRVATDAAERYAIVSKMLGNGMCYVRLLDGSTRDQMCIIRNKFKGRGKRDNILDSGSWVLVGLREWSSKQDTCDLLEVYNANERDRLLKNEPCFKSAVDAGTGSNNSSNSSSNNSSNSSSSSSTLASNVQFADSTTMKYSSMLAATNNDHDDEDDDEIPMQQRVYDMPPSSDEDEEEEEEEEEKPTPKPNNPNNLNNPNKPKPQQPKFKVCEINVDDI
jgi:initiation factor 1A